MGLVTATVTVTAPPDAVMAFAHRVEEFPAFMPDVVEVEVLTRDEATGVAQVRWVGKVEVQSIRKLVRWTEEERWDFAARRCDYHQLEGDYKAYRGWWTFEPSADGGTEVTLACDFDLGLPLVGPLINRLLDKLMRDNCQAMLAAIKSRAESADA